VECGTVNREWSTGGSISEFGVRDFVVSRVHDIAYSDFPIGKFPNRSC
jgi:hypothetical protein